MGLRRRRALLAPATRDHPPRGEPVISVALAEPAKTSTGSTRQLVAFALSAALIPLNSTMVAVALPAMAKDLDVAPASLTQWVVTSYLLTGIVCLSPAGKLGDLMGHRRSLVFGQLAFAAGAIAGYFAHHLVVITGARILMAAGGAVIVPSAMALLRIELPPERRGRAFGLLGSMMALAAAIGPLLGGMLSSRFGWSSIFVANVPPLAIAFLLARGGLPATNLGAKSPSFDVLGSVLIGSSLVLLVVGLRGKGAHSTLELAGGFALLLAFVLWERRVASPILDLDTFRTPAFAAGSAVIGLQNLAMYALLFELPVFVTQTFSLSPSASGRMLLSMMAAMVVSSPIGGRATERFGARTVVLVGSVTAFTGVCLLAVLTLRAPSDTVVPLILLGTGLGLSTAPAQAAAMSAIPAAKSGMASGVLSTSRYLGGVIGLAILGLVLVPGGDIAKQHVTACSLFAIALFVGGVSAFALPGRGVRAD